MHAKPNANPCGGKEFFSYMVLGDKGPEAKLLSDGVAKSSARSQTFSILSKTSILEEKKSFSMINDREGNKL